MRHLIKADIDRILRRKIIWIVLTATLFFMAVSVVSKISEAPDKNIAFTTSVSGGIADAGLLIGIVLILNIYADDFKSMTFISVIGRGVSRQKLIIAKFLDTLLILVNTHIVSVLFALILKQILSVSLSPDMVKMILLQSISSVICTTASVVIAAAFFYLTENSPLGVIAYLSAELLIPIGLHFVYLLPFISKFHPERYYFSGAASSMTADFMIGAVGDGLIKLVLILVIYVCCATLATILLFRKKELEF